MKDKGQRIEAIFLKITLMGYQKPKFDTFKRYYLPNWIFLVGVDLEVPLS